MHAPEHLTNTVESADLMGQWVSQSVSESVSEWIYKSNLQWVPVFYEQY